jgi:hypothetical protein
MGGDMSDEATFSAPEYDALVKGLEEARAQVKVRAAEAVAALFKAFFAAHTTAKAVFWMQYAPHFNDGEPCVFHVHDFAVNTKGALDWADVSSRYDDNDEPLFHDTYELDDGPLKEALRSLERAADEDVFEAAFGADAQIIATPEGFHVSECDHD